MIGLVIIWKPPQSLCLVTSPSVDTSKLKPTWCFSVAMGKEREFFLAIFNMDGKRPPTRTQLQILYHMYDLQFKFSDSRGAVVSIRPFDWFSSHCNRERNIWNFLLRFVKAVWYKFYEIMKSWDSLTSKQTEFNRKILKFWKLQFYINFLNPSSFVLKTFVKKTCAKLGKIFLFYFSLSRCNNHLEIIKLVRRHIR